MTPPTNPSKPDLEVRWIDEPDSLTEALVNIATELGVDPRDEPTRLQDVLDVDSLHALVDHTGETTETVQISFDIWGIQFTVTTLTVTATSDS
ncbi:hypothetical protein C453_14531 [Haloferax elongans ATCC BAA-1513]|uniref:Halobacterial output domain-containing protein n=1 Tax=Haloferax elongans ATCC BAA-1513 TaxID=1230453 RepID=M0HFD9_HALEO|nr:HalOD1 output domain-containing protein [Haloferax elongans]ELZ83230.1 hypothetical protein C453_14531 [Haloferax elongans ATCC BAA-1513]